MGYLIKSPQNFISPTKTLKHIVIVFWNYTRWQQMEWQHVCIFYPLFDCLFVWVHVHLVPTMDMPQLGFLPLQDASIWEQVPHSLLWIIRHFVFDLDGEGEGLSSLAWPCRLWQHGRQNMFFIIVYVAANIWHWPLWCIGQWCLYTENNCCSQRKRNFSCSTHKKHRYWPTHIPGKHVLDYFKSKVVGSINAVSSHLVYEGAGLANPCLFFSSLWYRDQYLSDPKAYCFNDNPNTLPHLLNFLHELAWHKIDNSFFNDATKIVDSKKAISSNNAHDYAVEPHHVKYFIVRVWVLGWAPTSASSTNAAGLVARNTAITSVWLCSNYYIKHCIQCALED